ncbi:MAG: peptidoglycan-associated lipoprotein Pal [Phenylobacterium sp.]|uniref:peptidoglycan-associated lipoprotein Pal n=1 Tax=Phenylobacterium sp. TaxID=1871053 RepID=UPI002600735C|nr:peptidoglycan-associated lipoprotein Pal [Phenylobacterium sp.]MCA6224357.1 peptidoglycan-associated lipoprotein Pal [Phenylobacterium sp.]MCA6225454.1 peptidoglycan-associated lipoprotein Pal [Phenylobacterium sp.]MCA6232102.1 peptidoglycan-associated lipoprotein Pal [Phenylobacterium sp.]MCA6235006.1 peptidoglycan-associated lipoprotein Pal [Phenylobacterium sp.]MCA6250070.1 peptidoglycan-associated lipoprotein Pal [Phenylobacterium sp.]
MTRNSTLRWLSLLSAAAILGACQTTPKPATEAPKTPEAATPADSATGSGAVQPVRRPAPVSGTPLPGTVQDFVINVSDRVFFDVDQYDVREDAAVILERQAAWLKRYPAVQVRIEGNADERGTREYNIALGSRRASAVRDYLVGLGVSPSRISTVSFGKERPIDPGADDEAFRRNRNAHTAIVSGAR